MTYDFAKEWSGPPLIKASGEALARVALPQQEKDFLRDIGLPSNARWFDPFCRGIMSFDPVATIRPITEFELAEGTAAAVSHLGQLYILGLCGRIFIAANVSGSLYAVNGGRGARTRGLEDPQGQKGRWSFSFINQGPRQFAASLIAYKKMIASLASLGYRLECEAALAAIDFCRKSIIQIDSAALAECNNYWAEWLDSGIW